MIKEIEEKIWNWKRNTEVEILEKRFRRLQVMHVDFLPILHYDRDYRFKINIICEASRNIVTKIKRIWYSISYNDRNKAFHVYVDFFDSSDERLMELTEKEYRSFVPDIRDIHQNIQHSFQNVLKNDHKTRLHYCFLYEFQEVGYLETIIKK